MLLIDTTVCREHFLLKKYRIKSSLKKHCCKGSRKMRVAPAFKKYLAIKVHGLGPK